MSAEKDNLETSAITQFAAALTAEDGGGNLKFIELCKPPEPDGYCTLNGQPLHIEVGHIYGTQSDVKLLLGRTGKSAPSHEQLLLSSMIPLQNRLLVPLNRLLADKAKKTYTASKIWLLIRSAFFLWKRSDFEQCLPYIAIPEAHPFEQIWLLCGPSASSGVLRLDKKSNIRTPK